MHDDVTEDVTKSAEACAPGDFAERAAGDAPGERQTEGPRAAQLENPYHRVFTRTPSLEALAHRAYEREKQANGRAAAGCVEKNEKNAPNDG